VVAHGWTPCDQQATGRALDALFDHFDLTGDQRSFERAVRMADSLASTVAAPTGAVLPGLLRASRETGDAAHLRAACRVAEHVVDRGQLDGARDPAMAWSFLLLWERTADARFHDSGTRLVSAIVATQHESGWFAAQSASSRPAERYAQLVQLASVVEALVGCAAVLRDGEVLERARRCADALLRRFEVDRALYSRYDQRWRSDRRSACLIGCGQMARSWLSLHGTTRDPWYLNAALKMNDHLCARQRVAAGAPGVRGAIVAEQSLSGPRQLPVLSAEATAAFCSSLIAERPALRSLGC